MRGSGKSEDSDVGPREPKIIAHKVLTGPLRVEVSTVRRLTRATEEESAREVDIETISGDYRPPTPPGNVYVTDGYSGSSEGERARRRSGPSRPLKRARGRPRKDGSGPFKPPSLTIDQVMAWRWRTRGEIPPSVWTNSSQSRIALA